MKTLNQLLSETMNGLVAYKATLTNNSERKLVTHNMKMLCNVTITANMEF